MSAFEVNNYLIREKLPEWWKDDVFLEPINLYTQGILVEMIGALLNNLGVVQPVQLWKELPEEYNWEHRYFSGDDYLDGKISEFKKDTPLIAYLPNTKRRCNAIITLSLLGDQTAPLPNSPKDNPSHVDIVMKNGLQQIQFNHIPSQSTIKINTETQEILINGVENGDLYDGFFKKIQPTAKNTNYDEVDIRDENKQTQIEFICSENITFDLKIELIKPVYTTEQHIRLSTVSAFPLESVKLYGFYCHEFNNKEEYVCVWEKTYEESSRVVFDKIATQFDFERFYISVKFKGIGIPLYFGFPQEIYPSNDVFAINEQLDKWGKIYGLSRRIYKDDISEDEEPFTLPKYYRYPIEQDYWYEQRMVNEYRYNNDSIDSVFLRDSNLNPVARIEAITPHTNDIYIYSESIIPEGDMTRETQSIAPCHVQENDDDGVSWEYPQAIMQSNIISEPILLQPLTSSSMNNHSYQTKTLDLKFKTPELPENIEITGIALSLEAETNIHSNNLKIDNRSQIHLPFIYTKNNGDKFTKIEDIKLTYKDKFWAKGQRKYVIGDEKNLFGLKEITREQIKDFIHCTIGFTNEDDFIEARLLLHTIKLKIYYNEIKDKFDISTNYDSKEIVLSSNKDSVKMKINIKNKGITDIKDKQVYIVVPPELTLIDNRPSSFFDLEAGQSFVMGDSDNDEIIIRSDTHITGRYDILLFCDEKVIQDEILVKKGFE